MTRRRRSAALGATLATCGALGLLLAPGSALAVAPTCQDLVVKTNFNTASSGHDPCFALGETITGITGTPQHGTLTFAGDVLTYTPQTGFLGEDDFTYTATASTGETTTASAAFLVDTPPTCADAQATTKPGKSLRVHFQCADPDPNGYTVLFGDPEHGTLSADGTTYTPKAGFVGTDAIAYLADDTFLRSAEHVLTITVGSPSKPPKPGTGGGGGQPTASAPVLGLVHPAQRIADARAHGVALTLTTGRTVTARVRVTIDKRTARKLRTGRLVGARTVSLRAGQRTIHVRLSRRLRRALRSLHRIRLTVAVKATDAAGRSTTRTLRVTLRR